MFLCNRYQFISILQTYNMDSELLIQTVQKYPCIYNSKSHEYRRTDKTKEWNAISLVMKLSDPECRKRWRSLKLGYVRGLHRMETRTGQAAKPVQLYQFHEQLSFLNDHVRKHGSSICTVTMYGQPTPATVPASQPSSCIQPSFCIQPSSWNVNYGFFCLYQRCFGDQPSSRHAQFSSCGCPTHSTDSRKEDQETPAA